MKFNINNHNFEGRIATVLQYVTIVPVYIAAFTQIILMPSVIAGRLIYEHFFESSDINNTCVGECHTHTDSIES